MKKIRCFIIDFCHTATVILVGFAAWKLVRHWRTGCAEKTGHTIDASIKTAADKLERPRLHWKNGPIAALGKIWEKALMRS